MELLVEPSEETVEEESLERLEDRIVEKLESRDIENTIEGYGKYMSVEISEDKAEVAVSALEYLTGLNYVYVCLLSDKDADSIAEELKAGEVDPGEFDLGIRGDTGEFDEDDVVEALEDQGWNYAEGARDLWIHVLEDKAFISLKRIEGAGGLPVDEEKTAILPMVDRVYTYAGFLMMKQGYSIIPIVKDKDTDRVKEGIDVLEEYQPGLKQILMDSDSWEEALGKAVEVFDPEIVVEGALESGEAILDDGEIDVPVKRPVEGISEQEVLERYNDIRSFRL